ncbi:uncharacterized protein CCDC162 [Colius striatus]|uniref:uncharacterized protein CCDC162 n=1 Tax=Colius striatus TaxID=57412 RepID=UPI002B1D497C|nr:uncharacterized protein CCDC162 [Colius striatus]
MKAENVGKILEEMGEKEQSEMPNQESWTILYNVPSSTKGGQKEMQQVLQLRPKSTKLSASTQHGAYQQHHLTFDPRGTNRKRGITQRPNTVPSRWKEIMAEKLSPHQKEMHLPTVLMQLQKRRLAQK